MHPFLILALVLVASEANEPPFPLRTDPRPPEWKIDEINNGLPDRGKGTVHVLAWEVTEGYQGSRHTQALVIKRFDQPNVRGRARWVMALLNHLPNDKKRPWYSDIYIPSWWPGEKMPEVTDAEAFGHEFYNATPTDKQIEAFLRETHWRPCLGLQKALDYNFLEITYSNKLIAGGVDRTLWKKLFGRDVPTDLFPELTKAPDDNKR